LKDLINNGGKVWLDGRCSKDQPLLFYPTVVEAASDKVKAFNEEIFGPLAVLYKFEDDMDVISRANSTNYGLASYVYTKDREAIKKYTKLLDFGIVCFNEGSFSNPVAPFGGTKDSGFGREGGSYGLEEFLETKFTSIS
jgi:succinate-semialdehyde dehydrogenase/glutarate-semialdehyde dehydrogenase